MTDVYDTQPLLKGDTFDTVAPDGETIETGCVVTVPPAETEQFGGKYVSFLGLDSEGVECQFITAMIKPGSVQAGKREGES